MSKSPRRTAPGEGQTEFEEVLLVLEQIRTRGMVPEQRLALLRALRDRVEELAAILLAAPRPAEGQPQWTPGDCACGKLTHVWCGNLRHLLHELGYPRAAGQASYAVYREWVVRQLMRDLGRLVEAAARCGQVPPRGTWLALHDLFFYLEGRDELAEVAGAGRFSPGREYRRLLLAGVLSEDPDGPRLFAEAERRLPGWACSAALRRDARTLGDASLLRLDLAVDAPPRRQRPGDAQPFQGWVLEAPAGFLNLLARRAPTSPRLAVAA